MEKNINSLLDGIIVPLITPLEEPGVPNIQHLRNIIDHVLKNGVHGIFILGTTGEGPDFSFSRQCQIVSETCLYSSERTNVFVGVINMDLNDAISIAEFSADNKADCIVLAAPYYPISQKEILDYSKEFISKCPLPVCLYNRPGQNDIVFKLDLIKELFEFDNLIGIKDTSGDISNFKKLIELRNKRENWQVSMGYEYMVAEAMPLGADGGISGGANLFPKLYVKLYDAALKNDLAEVNRIQNHIETFVGEVYNPDYLTGLKYAMECKGMCSGMMADPGIQISQDQKERIKKFLSECDGNVLFSS